MLAVMICLKHRAMAVWCPVPRERVSTDRGRLLGRCVTSWRVTAVTQESKSCSSSFTIGSQRQCWQDPSASRVQAYIAEAYLRSLPRALERKAPAGSVAADCLQLLTVRW